MRRSAVPVFVAYGRISNEVGYGILDDSAPPGIFSNTWRDGGGLTVVLSGRTFANLEAGSDTILLICRNFGASPIRFHPRASRSFLSRCLEACRRLPIRVVVFANAQEGREPSLEYQSPGEALRKVEEIIGVFSDL